MIKTFSKKNPFDRNINEKPLISILVNTGSYEKEILEDNTFINKLLSLSYYGKDDVDVLFTLTQNEQVKECILKYNVKIVENYKYDDENGLTIKLSDKSKSYFFYAKLNNYNLEGSTVKKEDYVISKEFDFFVVNENDPFYSSEFKRANDVSISTVMNYARLLFVNNGIYLDCDESFYNLYKFQKTFHAFIDCWTIATYSFNGTDLSSVFDQLNSLSIRLRFIGSASEKISYYYLKTSNKSIIENILYQFGYFIMLSTGIFDDLAWIIKHLYSFAVKHWSCELKNGKDNGVEKVSQLVKLIQNLNQPLFDYLTKTKTQDMIKVFYPLRDQLQHRGFIYNISYSSIDSKIDKLVIDESAIENIEKLQTYNFLKNVDIRKHGKLLGLNSTASFNSYEFTKDATRILAEIVNNTLAILKSDFYNKVSIDKKDLVDEALEKNKAGLLKMHELTEEPIFL